MITMKNMKWFFPETLSEADKLLKDGYKAHGGGTFLVKTSLNFAGLFNLSGIPELKQSKVTSEVIRLGSALSYSDGAALLESEVPGNLISKALSGAAACPLRNRITLGGSIYASPKWSDIIGPLIACGAKLELTSATEAISVSDYLRDRDLRHSGIITTVIIPRANITGDYYRFTKTTFDYPFFTISASVRTPELFHAVLTGTASGTFASANSPEALLKTASGLPAFNRERGISGEYIGKRAEVEFKRLINRATGVTNE